MSSKFRRAHLTNLPATLAAVAMLLGCDNAVTSPDSIDRPDGADGGTTGAEDAGGTKPLYALGAETFTLTSATSYVMFVDSLDAQPDVTLASAREFPGYAPVSAASGKVFVNSGETPTISRFVIGDDKSWVDDGSVSFSRYGSAPVSHSVQFSDTLAYAPTDPATFVRWNPMTFDLGEPAIVPTELVPASMEGGFTLNRGYGYLTAGNLAYQSFYYSTQLYLFHPTSYVGVLDSTSNQWTGAIAANCPHLHVVSAGDEGVMYFSPGQGSVVTAVYSEEAPRNCMVRIKAGETTLDGEPVFFKDLAEGREGSNFFYIGNGVGFFSAYHRERATPAELTSPQALAYSANYHLWTLDLNTMTAKIMEGIDFGGGQYSSFRFDGRVFVAMPAADYGSTTIYEITSDGKAERRFTSQAWVYNIVKVR